MPSLSAVARIRVARACLAVYSIAIAWITLAPARDAGQVTGVVGRAAEIASSTGLISNANAYTAFEFLANIALFVPFGLFFKFSFPRLPWWLIVSIGFTTSLSIELIQLGIPSRFSTVSDVVANTLGTACLLHFFRRPDARPPGTQRHDAAKELA